MIKDSGIEEIDGCKKYSFFDCELFGFEEFLECFVEEYFYLVVKWFDVRKWILLLMGFVSGGKFMLVMMLKKGLEVYILMDNGVVYVIKGCLMYEDFLYLIFYYLCDDFYREYGIRIEGSFFFLNVMRLEEEYGGRIEDVKVECIFFLEDKCMGIGIFSLFDLKFQDIVDLMGSIDFLIIVEYGLELDLCVYWFDGELNKVNCGMMEFQEMLKCDEKFFWYLFLLIQEGNFKVG